jgi:CRP-like cAMP-binding protein
MEKYFDILDTCPLFDQVGRENYEKMLRCFGARCVSVKKGNPVFHEGQTVRYVGIVLTGSIQTVQEDYLGNRSILSMATPGQLFAEGFACAGIESLPVSIVAATDSQIILIDCSHIMTLCHHVCSFHNQMIRNMLSSVARSNLQLNQKIEILSKRTTREKVMAYLLSEAAIQGTDSFTIPYDRQELADFLGVERSAMSAVISKLRDDGHIKVNRRQFQLIR